MQTFVQDVRYALRLLRRSPGFAITAILTLAVAIGANAAVFSAVEGVLIAPLPYPKPSQLVRLFEESSTTPRFPMSPADFRDYREELQTFAGLAAYLRADLQIGDGQQAEQLRGMQVSSGFFSLLGAAPVLGREFEANDEITGNDAAVILSHGLWRRRFGSDPGVVDRTVRLSGKVYRIVGVLPEGFKHVGGTYRTYGHDSSVDVWSVLAVPREDSRGLRFSHYYNVVGRVRDGVEWAVMQEDLHRVGVSVAKRYPTPNSPWMARAIPLKDEIVGTADSTLVLLAAAAAAVLVLACVNIAGLLLGRGAMRFREIGVRSALGASRWRLSRQLFVESAVLAVAGAVMGIGLAYLAVAALARFGPADLPRLQMIAVNARVLMFVVAVTCVSALMCGFAPALRLVRAGENATLREDTRTVAGSAQQRLQRILAGAEVALAFVLVVSGGLLLRSFATMLSTNPGFDSRHVLTASLELPTARYDRKAATEFYRRVVDRVRILPGVRAVSVSSDLPWTNYDENTGFEIVGRSSPAGDGPEARYHFLTADYTRAVGTPLVAGREVSAADGPEAPPVVLLNEAAARRYWTRAEAAVGARVNLWGAERTVAGVIGDVRDTPWHLTAEPALYFPQPQMWYAQPMFLIVRSDLPSDTMVEPLRRAVRELDSELPLANVRPLDAVAGAAISARRLALSLVATFGLVALFLAVIGIYGVIAQAVQQRSREFGVRQALGATRGDIMRLVFSSGAVLTVTGLVGGIALAIVSTRLLTALLYGVTPLDVPTFAGVAIILLASAAGAAYVPARRATRISAAAALRD